MKYNMHIKFRCVLKWRFFIVKIKSLNCIFSLLLCINVVFLPMTRINAEESSDVIIVDKDSSVRVKLNPDVYKKGYHLNVTVVDRDLLQKNSKLYDSFDESQKAFAENYKFYNIQVLSEANEKIEPNDLGTVTVYVPVDANFEEKDLKVLQLFYGQNNDVTLPGEILTLDGKRYFSFQCTNLDSFAVVDVDTNKTLPILLWAIAGTFLIAGAVISIVLLIRKHRKKYSDFKGGIDYD